MRIAAVRIPGVAKVGLAFVSGVAAISFGTSCALAAATLSAPSAAVFSDSLPGFDQGLARDIAAQAQAAGYRAEFIATEVLTNHARLSAGNFDLLVLPGARSLPALAAPVVEQYLQAGGDLLALGAPAWQSPLFRLGRDWFTPEGYEQALASQRPQRLMEAFVNIDLARWTKSTSEREPRARYVVVDADRGRALHVTIDHLGSWEALLSPPLAQPFATNHSLTCFRAKGGPGTRQLAFEWDEADGSRWIATVDLTREWKNYALPPNAFKVWESPGRGQKGDHFKPQNAVRCSVGVAVSHTALEGDRHEYWIEDVGTAPTPFGDEALTLQAPIPRLESLSPGYQCFPITTPALIRPSREKVALADWERADSAGKPGPFVVVSNLFGLHPRPRGVGFDQRRPFRWEPLLGAYDKGSGDYRGAIGALLVHVTPPFRGSVWAVFTPAEAAFYREPLVTNCLRQVLTRLRRGLFLSEGGSEFFTVFSGQNFKVGAQVVNFGRATATNLSVAVDFQAADGGNSRSVIKAPFDLGINQDRSIAETAMLKSDRERSVVAVLTCGGTVIDALEHEIGVWQPGPKPEFIEARDGGFWWRGKSWKAHGVNYMPSTGIGVANPHFFEHWLGRGSYEPAVIERDLRRIRAMNLNAVSVFIYHESLGAQHLLDFLRRCDALGLRVNQSLRPGTPMDFRWTEMKELIEFYQLARNDAVFAYDLAWEPGHGDHAQQQRAYAALWNDWVNKRYGSTTAAEKAWGVAAPREPADAPAISVPPMKQLIGDGEWRRLAADYRLFLDQLLQEKYSAARRLVRSIDSHHAVSFRMSLAGDPTFNGEGVLPYDFYGLAEAVDIWEPEAYGRIGDWERVKAGEFTAAYARLCDPGKPLIWAEMGYNAWDPGRMAPDADKLAFEARYYADFYRMLNESGANGVFFWWYPGGYRLNENSDFGIINPDGTDRPVTKIIRNEGARFLQTPGMAKPDDWITVDRDRDARGLFGIYESAKAEFWKTVAEGHRPGLKWERKPGSAVR